MSEKERALLHINTAEEMLKKAKRLLEKSEAHNLFHALKYVEFAKDTLSDARESMVKIYRNAENK